MFNMGSQGNSRIVVQKLAIGDSPEIGSLDKVLKKARENSIEIFTQLKNLKHQENLRIFIDSLKFCPNIKKYMRAGVLLYILPLSYTQSHASEIFRTCANF